MESAILKIGFSFLLVLSASFYTELKYQKETARYWQAEYNLAESQRPVNQCNFKRI